MLIDIKTLQAHLLLEPDGIAGPKTREAVENAFAQPWSYERKLIAAQQRFLKSMGFDVGEVDGFVGPQTLYALEEWQNAQRERDGRPLNYSTHWPRQKDMQHFYGDIGQHQTQIILPYSMKLAWNTHQVVSKMTLHEKCAQSALRVFTKVLEHYGQVKISELRLDLFGGSLNVRKMRGGTSWSIHSWGAAIDIDPENNQLRWTNEKASLDAPAYDFWWKCWEEEGWVSLGRQRNYDWMHVQAARL